jgi:FMN phosphatase YigB (HAD superfamily)
MSKKRKRSARLLVTDLDNTLWDWFTIWHRSFSVLLAEVSAASGIPVEQLEDETRAVHQRRGTSEYSYLLGELPSLLALHPDQQMVEVYCDAIHKFRSARKAHTKLYPGVAETLAKVKSTGVRVVAYTESISFVSATRLQSLGLDGVIDVLYSSPDHDFPIGINPQMLRSLPPEDYAMKATAHRHVPKGVLKPDGRILREILDEMGVPAEDAVYVGDSLMKDVAMAREVGAMDVLAQYGVSHTRKEYALLQRVSHWTEEDVLREKEINAQPHVTPSVVLERGFDELLDHFEFEFQGP